jgi:hypothetical protein
LQLDFVIIETSWLSAASVQMLKLMVVTTLFGLAESELTSGRKIPLKPLFWLWDSLDANITLTNSCFKRCNRVDLRATQ